MSLQGAHSWPLVSHHHVGKKKKKPPVSKERGVIHTWCRGSVRIKLVIPGGGFPSCFLFSKGYIIITSSGMTRASGEFRGGVQRGSGCNLPSLSTRCPGSRSATRHCRFWKPEDPTPARQMVTPETTGKCPPPLLNRAVSFQSNSGKTSETIREDGETAQSNKQTRLKKIPNQPNQKTLQTSNQQAKKPYPTESISAWDYFTLSSTIYPR